MQIKKLVMAGLAAGLGLAALLTCVGMEAGFAEIKLQMDECGGDAV